MTGQCILVTGACGLLGRGVLESLSARGERVVGVDRVALGETPGAFESVDLRDFAGLCDVVERHEVGRIVHCGGISGRAVGRDDPHGTIEINVGGTANVFEAARLHAVHRVVFCSSASVYGQGTGESVLEDAPLGALNAYAASKIGCEAILEAYARDWGVDGVALRIFQVYGPRRRTHCHLRAMIKAALAGETAVIAHSGASRRQYVYVDDVVSALVLALDAPRLDRRTYNIAGDGSMTLNEVAGTVQSVLPGLEVAFGDDPLSAEYALGPVDQSRARRDLGYVPAYGLRDGVARYAQWLRHHDY